MPRAADSSRARIRRPRASRSVFSETAYADDRVIHGEEIEVEATQDGEEGGRRAQGETQDKAAVSSKKPRIDRRKKPPAKKSRVSAKKTKVVAKKRRRPPRARRAVGCEKACCPQSSRAQQKEEVCDACEACGTRRNDQRAASRPRRHQPSRPRNPVPSFLRRPNWTFVPRCREAPARRSYYITTAISYPNGVPHIGHAYEAIATDAIARFMRLDGYDVYFLTGTDEHGQKIQQTAAREGLTARELVERNVPRFQAMVERMNCSNDDFIRTTEDRHHASSKAIWEQDAGQWRHLSRQICRLVFGARRGAISPKTKPRLNEQGAASGDRDRHAGRVGGGGELFLPSVRLSGQAARPLRRASGFRSAEGAAERGRELREGRPAGPLDLAHHLRLGRAACRATTSTSCMCGSTR